MKRQLLLDQENHGTSLEHDVFRMVESERSIVFVRRDLVEVFRHLALR